MIEVELPDGSIAEFPDGMPPEQIQAVLQRQFGTVPLDEPQQVPQEATAPEQYGGGMGMFRAATDASQAGLMGGFDDEIGAAMMAPIHAGMDWFKGDGFDVGRNYTRLQKQLDDQKKTRRSERPATSIAGEIAGGLALGGGAAKAGLSVAGKALPVIGKTGAAMLEGGAYGGLYGAGEAAPGERLAGAGTGATIGAITGGLMERGGQMLANRAARKALPVAQTSDDLAARSSAAYDIFDRSGGRVKPQAINKTIQNAQIKLKRLGFDPDVHPETASIAKKLFDKQGQPISLREIENIRMLASDASREAAKGRDRNASRVLVEQIDQLFDDARNFSGNTSQALAAVKDARALWKTKIKTEVIEDLVEKAKNQATGFENGLVIQFRALANNKQKMKAFTPEEQKMIKDVVRRASLRGVLRAIGMLSPNSTFGGIVFGGTTVGGGFLPAVGMGAAGYGARRAAEAMTRGKVSAVQRAVSSGQTLPQLPNRLRPFIPGSVAGVHELKEVFLPRQPR